MAGSFASAFGECNRFSKRTEVSIRIDLDKAGSKYAVAQLRILFFHANEHVTQDYSVFIRDSGTNRDDVVGTGPCVASRRTA